LHFAAFDRLQFPLLPDQLFIRLNKKLEMSFFLETVTLFPE